MRIKQRHDASAKLSVGTGLQQEGFPFRWIGSGNRLVEEVSFNVGNFLHRGGSVYLATEVTENTELIDAR
jgi:hypothetical protein